MAEKQNIEDLFRSSLGEAEVTPSPRTWKKLQRRLRMQRFMRFDPARFNVYYAGVLVVGTALILSLSERNLDPESVSQAPPPPPPAAESREAGVTPESRQLLSSEREIRAIQGTDREESQALSGAPDGGHKDHSDPGEPGHDGILSEAPGVDQMEKNRPADVTMKMEAREPVAGFTPSVSEGCAPLVVRFRNSSLNAAEYHWDFGNGEESSQEDPRCTFTAEGTYEVSLAVTGPGGETALARQSITVWAAPAARFETGEKLEGTRLTGLNLLNYSTGGNQWEWSFADAKGSATGDWSSEAFQPSLELGEIPPGARQITLVATGHTGCRDTFSAELPPVILDDGEKIKFPTAFSGSSGGPTGGHYNPGARSTEIFRPHFVMEPERYHLRIFSRTGELVYESVDIYRGWDGYIMEERAAGGVYLWMAEGTWENGASFSLRGDVTLLWGDRWP